MNEEMRQVIRDEVTDQLAIVVAMQRKVTESQRELDRLTNEKIKSIEAELESLGRVVEALGVWAEIEIQQLESVNKD